MKLLLLFSFQFVIQSSKGFLSQPIENVIQTFQEKLLENQLVKAQFSNEVHFFCLSSIITNLFILNVSDNATISRLDLSLPLAFIIHGWMDKGDESWVLDILTHWIKYQEINVCAVDWQEYSNRDYKFALLRIYDVGASLTYVVTSLQKYGFKVENITFVGYSLGAHAAGFAGSELNGKIDQIIGLDPAGPLITMPYVVGERYRLDQTDANFVQIIHTSSGTLGTNIKSGHADFYPNGGGPPQTNCVFNSRSVLSNNKNPLACSHSIVKDFFKFSMDPKLKFIGWNCLNYKHFIFGLCRRNEISRFGIHSDRKPGNFYFKTRITSPYVERQQT